jgi:hypothetical protein
VKLQCLAYLCSRGSALSRGDWSHDRRRSDGFGNAVLTPAEQAHGRQRENGREP